MPPTYSTQAKRKKEINKERKKERKKEKKSPSGLGFKSTGQPDTARGLQMEILLQTASCKTWPGVGSKAHSISAEPYWPKPWTCR
jgi:hypothetical protein